MQSIPLQRQIIKKKSRITKPKQEFHVGERILHNVFGEGTVLSVTSMANDAMLEVGFDQVGTKKLMANHARIKKLG